MKKRRRPIIIGNWKMNPPTLGTAKDLLKTIKRRLASVGGVEVVIAPPFVYLSDAQTLRNGSRKFFIGAQDVHWEKYGAQTGEISLEMLKSLGISYVIVGHSERRALGENDESINKKLVRITKEKLIAVLCVGEKKRDTHGNYFAVVEKQLRDGLKGLPKAKLAQVIIAYEPVWAIGTGDTAQPEDAHEMKLFIQKTLSHMYGRNFGQNVKVLYGGSVNAKNAEELFVSGMVDGFLVGGASLRGEEFVEIVKIARVYGT